MAYAYRWTIERVDGYPQRNGLENVAAVVYWEVEARLLTDGSVHSIRGATELPEPDPAKFTDYLELSPEDILPWVWALEEGGKEGLEKLVGDQLTQLLNPEEQLQTLSMPWLASCCPDGTGIDAMGVYYPPEPPAEG